MLIGGRSDIGYSLQKLQPGWNAIEISSVEAYATININLSNNNEVIKIPAVACFLFSCTKPKRSKYNLAWATSLS